MPAILFPSLHDYVSFATCFKRTVYIEVPRRARPCIDDNCRFTFYIEIKLHSAIEGHQDLNERWYKPSYFEIENFAAMFLLAGPLKALWQRCFETPRSRCFDKLLAATNSPVICASWAKNECSFMPDDLELD